MKGVFEAPKETKMPDEKDPQAAGAPKPEMLQPQAETMSPTESGESGSEKIVGKPRRITYRPSHKATFIGIAVVALILLANVGILMFLLRDKTSAEATKDNEVTLSGATLDKLGMNRSPTGNEKTALIIGPNSEFRGEVKIGGNTSIGGQLILNSKFTAGSAAINNFEAGKTSVQEININGDATATTLNLRKDLTAVGTTRLQGPTTIGQLLTVNNNANITGNLAVGGTLSTKGLSVSNLTADGTLTIGGHIITRGSAPSVSSGSGVGSEGTVSISGNDAAGTVAVNFSTGAGPGTLANVQFRSSYSNTPKVIITPVGRAGAFYVNRTANGFSIESGSAQGPGGMAFDYIVMQ